MSFRTRLSLFFVAIVIVPMVSVAVVLFSLIADNEDGKADARLAAMQRLARDEFVRSRERASRLAVRIGGDGRLATALREGDERSARVRSERLLQELGAVRIRIEDRRGERVDVGHPDGIAPATRDLVVEGGAHFGVLEVSDRSAGVFVREVRRLTGMDVVVRSGDRKLAATRTGIPPDDLPDEVGDIELGGKNFRAASFDATGFGTAMTRVTLLMPKAAVQRGIAQSRVLIAGVLAGFFLLAIACAVLVSRSLQAQIAAFLQAAQRLARGDFRTQVPTSGRDEFAALGEQFNRMAAELEGRLEELRRQRTRLEGAMRRLGEAFASGLNREALLAIAVRTAVDGVEADGGRAILLVGAQPASTGDAAGLETPIDRVEREALASGVQREAVTDGASVLAHPLRSPAHGVLLGVVSVWRRSRPFERAERELLQYLVQQAAVSLDNVALHETVQRQAVTDELTGLANHRRFQEALASELERTRRFDQPLGLVMLDIDNFKDVNDTYGHQVGDRVLAEVSRILREQSREIDAPARYGGEELVVVLPGTDLQGAYNLAERVREGIQSLEVPLDGTARGLRITASFGAASVPESAHDQATLIAAADSALYAAKRAGKNRTARAEPEGARPSQ